MSAPVTVRHAGNVVVAVAVWVFCAGAIVDGLLRGSPGYVLHVCLVVAAVSLAAWMIFVRTRLVVADDGLRMINVLRSYEIPFGALVSWQVGGVMSAEIRTDGDRIRKLTSWGAPGIRRQRPQMSSLSGRGPAGGGRAEGRGPGSAGPAVHPGIDSRSVTELAIESRQIPWQRSHPAGDDTIARIRWNWPQLLALAALIVVNVAVG